MKRLVFTAPRKVDFEDMPDRSLASTEIRVKSIFNGISHGTELNFYRGTAPHFSHAIEDGLFRRNGNGDSAYPVWHGYETVGEVVETGQNAIGCKRGDLVWCGSQHADLSICDTTPEKRPFFMEVMPEGAQPSSGIFMALGGVAYDGVLTSNLRLGEAGVVSGLGCIGLIAIQLLANAGVKPLIGIDPLPMRRKMALDFGADHVLDPATGSIAEQIRDLNSGNGVDAVIETSGNWKALHEAIRMCASGYGRTVALGFYQGKGEDLRLGEEFHHSSFYPMGASSILAINHRGDPAPGRAWDRVRVYRKVAEMLGDQRIKTDGLITHTFAYEDAAQAFELIDNHPQNVFKVALTF